jgi:UDP-N-acetylglucosamine acyltransferase
MIHTTAIVHKAAELAPDVEVGPYSVIGEEVVVGKGTKIGAHAVLEGPTRIGEQCQIFPFASIGSIAQDVKYRGEKTELLIGDRNIFREFVTMNRATADGEGKTVIGSDNFFMAYSHVAHNCVIGNGVIMANAATLAGHIEIEDYAIIGGLAAVHQFVRIGAYAIISGLSGAAMDIPPYMLASGSRAKLFGLNIVGLKRHGFSSETINKLKQAYRILFRRALPLPKAVATVKEEVGICEEVNHLLSFIENSKRGVCR